MTAERKPVPEDRHYEVEAVLAWHDDNARAAISTLLDDCRYLRSQLARAEGANRGSAVRGWVPITDGE